MLERNRIPTGDTRSHYPGRAATLDLEDAAASRFGHIDVVSCLFLVTNIRRNRLSIISRNAQYIKREFVVLLT